jgi:hypothetical protein
VNMKTSNIVSEPSIEVELTKAVAEADGGRRIQDDCEGQR